MEQYEEFLKFKQEKENSGEKPDEINTNVDVEVQLLNDFLSKFPSEECETLSINPLEGFPIPLIDKVLHVHFNIRTYCFSAIHYAIVKYIFNFWTKLNAKNFTQEELEQNQKIISWIEVIKNHLIEVANMNKEEYEDIMWNSRNPRYNRGKHYMYYTWWLYGYFPLIENGDELILKLLQIVFIDDAQDMLLWGILQINDSTRIFNLLKQILLILHQQDKDGKRQAFDPFSSGTGALSEIILLFDKLRLSVDENGVDLKTKFLSDPELSDVWIINDIDYRIKYFTN